MIILKVTKSQGFTLSLEYAFLKKPQEGGGGGLKLTLTLAFQRLDKVFLVAMSQ